MLNLAEFLFEHRGKNTDPSWLADVLGRLVWLVEDNKEPESGLNLDGLNLDGLNLDGLNLDGLNLDGLNLDGLNLDIHWWPESGHPWPESGGLNLRPESEA